MITLNLSINTVSDLSISQNGASVTAVNSNATYQWLDCGNNYSIIIGDTNQMFNATSNGSYAVELTENGCKDTSSCINITVVGIDEPGNDIDLRVYPNPVSDIVQVTIGHNLKNVELFMTDAFGRIVFRRHYENLSHTKIEMPESSGIYFLSIKTKDWQKTNKLLKH